MEFSCPFPPPLLLLFAVFITSLRLLLSSSAAAAAAGDDYRYVNCSASFSCGRIDNVKYPFWGGNRADYCGRSEFQLECESGVPQIITTSDQFRVLSLDPGQRTMSVALSDLWNGECPHGTAAFDSSSIFRYASGLSNLTLYYNCSLPPSILQLQCSINGEGVSLYALPYSSALCKSNLTIPILESVYEELTSRRESLDDAVKKGVELMWEDVFGNQCGRCEASGGQCGYNHTLSQFACFCRDHPYNATCPDQGGSSNHGTVIGVAVGSAGVGIGLLGAACCVLKRRKRPSQSKSNGVGGGAPPSSSELPLMASPFTGSPATPSTGFYRSTPSDARTDIESGSTYYGVRVFSYDELEEATGNFDASKQLGDGGFGVVYYGKLRDGRAVAVKRLYERSFKRVEQFMNEVEILNRLRHPNLVTLFGCTSRRSRELLLVYEYIPNGTLADHLHGSKSSSSSSSCLSWPLRLAIAVETADALAYLHASDIIHRDVKTANILIDDDFRVKVADFGLSRFFPTNATHVSTAPQGTPGYVDPEYYRCYHLTDKSDVYSFGVVLMELVSSKMAVDPSRTGNDFNLASMAVGMIQKQGVGELVDPGLGFEGDGTVRGAVTAVAELAFRCLQQKREMRPCMEEVVEGLRRIQGEMKMKMNNAKIDDDGDDGDVVGGEKGKGVQSFSPDSVVNAKWVSTPSTTANSLS